MNIRSSRHLLAVSVLALPFLTSAAAAPAPDGSAALPGETDPVSTCPNKGIAYEDPVVVSVGPDACTGTGAIEVEIGYDEFGAPVTFSSASCPQEITIKPGHNGEVQKTGMRTTRAGAFPYIVKRFECSGQPLLLICIPAGEGPGPESVDNFDEQSCEGPGAIH